MKTFGIIGWKNSGKTDLVVRLVSDITARGLSVSTVKHAHHGIGLNFKDADGREMLNERAHQSVIVSRGRWFLTQETNEETGATLDEHLARFKPVDLILIEGYKLEGHPKLETHRRETKKDLIAKSDPSIVAVASNRQHDNLGVPQFDLDNTESISRFILGHTGLA